MKESKSTDAVVSDKGIADRVKFRRKDIPGLVARYVIAIGLIVYILTFIDEVDFSRLYQLSWTTIVGLVGLKTIVYLIMSIRLRLLLDKSDVHVPVSWVYGINNVGLLISYLTPSSVLSDIGKIFFFRRFRHNTIRIFVALFLDRLLGLFCILLILGIGALALYVQNPNGFWRIFIGAALIKTAILIGAVIAVFLLPVLFWKISFFRAYIKKHFSFLTISLGVKIVALSMASHLVFCYLVFACAKATSEVPITLADAAVVFPMSSVATAVPTTPGAIGVGQVVYKYLIDTLTMSSTDAGILIFTLLQLLDIPFLLWGLISGVILIVGRDRSKPIT